MEVSEETSFSTSNIPETLGIIDTPADLFWDAYWTLDDDEWEPESSMAAL